MVDKPDEGADKVAAPLADRLFKGTLWMFGMRWAIVEFIGATG